MNKSKKSSPEEIRRKKLVLISAFTTAIIVALVLGLSDLIKDIRLDASAYELRYESDATYPMAGKVYTLYVDGNFRANVDQNRYCMVDENGNTDYRYCALMEDASSFTYFAIFLIMMYIVLLIAKDSIESTPFTKDNIRRIKIIAFLQLSLCILPGLVRMLMSFFRFNYSNTVLDEKSLFMFAIAFVIGAIAFIFERGLKLQEDVDSIA